MNKCLMSTKFNIPVSLIVTLSDHENWNETICKLDFGSWKQFINYIFKLHKDALVCVIGTPTMTSYNYDADLVIWEQWTKTEKQKIAEQASTTINALHNKVIKIRKNMQQKLLACRYIER